MEQSLGPRPSRRPWARSLGVAVVLLGPGGCAATADTGPAVSSSEPSEAIPSASGTDGAGSMSLEIAEPRELGGSVDATVACSTGRVYRAQATAGFETADATVSVTARGYSGDGTYPVVVGVNLVPESGQALAVSGVRATADLSDTGGSVSFSATAEGGRTVAGSARWACS
jgi:hypothetical protein